MQGRCLCQPLPTAEAGPFLGRDGHDRACPRNATGPDCGATGSGAALSTTEMPEIDRFIYERSFHYFRMLTNNNSQDEETRKAITQIARSLEEISEKVDQANMKLDHLIETYRDNRYAYRQHRLYDLFRDNGQE